MTELLNLNSETLKAIASKIPVPAYDRTQISAGILHIGVGGFHRAHQAFYTDKVLSEKSPSGWGICGICLLERDKKMFDVMARQDGLYTLLHKKEGSSPAASVIGSIVEYHYAPQNPLAVIQRIADPSVKIISLTITEGGYNHDDATGEFNWSNRDVIFDRENPGRPRTVFGYLAAALKKRKKRDLPVTILSCDNIQHNGRVTKQVLTAFVKEAAPELLDWIEENVSFPNSMVDRITPATTHEDITLLREAYGVNDLWPVVSEEFCQWIIEDNFIAGRPEWETAGVQFVADVDPYEKMKLRILNGGHSLTGLAGWSCGYRYIHEAMADPLIVRYLKDYMDKDVTPTLDAIGGIDIEVYKATVIDRFKNPYLQDTVARIIMESSSKIPKFVLPVISENVEERKSISRAVGIVALWYCYLTDLFLEGHFDQVQDTQRELLLRYIQKAEDPSADYFLSMTSVFGQLASSAAFRAQFLSLTQEFRTRGVKALQDMSEQ